MAIELNQIWDFPIKDFHPFPNAKLGVGAHDMLGVEAKKFIKSAADIDQCFTTENLFDLYQSKIYISSSSASILKSKKSFLTGRNSLMEIPSLDFNEYLHFKNIKISKSDQHLVPVHFSNFLSTGGIPEYVLKGDISFGGELDGK